ncbi:cobalt-precorrin-5B (C1)-methyltransferase [Microvirga lupini]|uniref:Cobalt-precorrin-5B C(1)-methyltransferase n=1 Tax=Microvirga lupini TaxID=420324 RepID=A0A7W4VPM8_9HYPH|nr:cobalt-precorrin-5B (C(1))-methyltransferase [Microvirga lupini]MBB3020731.1 cobalt-precorrin-5B (C1)-methyltransferase [Microvirga lupini]
MDESKPAGPLRRGWTTGACATAAAKAAYLGWRTGECPDPVEIVLPGGARPAFSLALTEMIEGGARVGIVKDAGDDPDVTHGALVIATVRAGQPGSGVTFRAGEGVGTVTRAGLPLPPGEPAINPVPRQMIRDNLEKAARGIDGPMDIDVEISIPGGEAIAQKTLNPRLGILGGLSILGTTGVVVPYSCSAWIHSIYRGIDVARAGGLDHVAGATGSTSEKAVQALYNLPDHALIDMGDFAGGMLKYLRRNPVPKVTIAGGFAKMTKLGQGLLDLHSRSGAVDLAWLSERLLEAGAEPSLAEQARGANTALEVLEIAKGLGLPLADVVAQYAWQTASRALRNSDIALEITVFDRDGRLVGRVPFHPVA